MMARLPLLHHCHKPLFSFKSYRVPNNDITGADYSPWLLVYKAHCPLCRQLVMGYQPIDDYGKTSGPLQAIKPKHQQQWIARIHQQGNPLHRKGADRVTASRREIPYDLISVPVR